MNSLLPTFKGTTIEQVAAKLRIACEPWMQDWPVEVADGTRIDEFLEHYEKEESPEHRLVIAEVLLVSLDHVFSHDRPSDEVLGRLAAVFRKHPTLLDYWLCPDAASDEEMFAITQWLRRL